MPNLRQGQIIWKEVPDSNGYNCYRRPVIILNRTVEIAPAEKLTGVVVSVTAYDKNPRPADYIEIPYHRQGRVRTKLKKPCVAVCSWLIELDKQVPESDICGIVPPQVMEEIINAVRSCHE
ncbi:MAG: type II toxin-antitoxin system PemK/MazF family toxin [Planctomycetes bacterium]|nr:type II toxin-antitoxin system PemK/MazF family toxin [Planctomycetota bacterium]